MLEYNTFQKQEGVSTLEEARQIITQQSAAITALLARIEYLESRLAPRECFDFDATSDFFTQQQVSRRGDVRPAGSLLILFFNCAF